MAKRVIRPQVESQRLDVAVETASGAARYRIDFRWLLFAICLLGLLLRIWNVVQTAEVPTSYSLSGDSIGYFEWAAKIAAGQWVGDIPFYQAPLYPYSLALLMKGFGAQVVGIRLFQALLGSVGVGLIGLAGRSFFAPGVGLLSAFFLAVYPPAIYYDGIIQKTSLASFLLCGMLAALGSLKHRPNLPFSLCVGLLLGLLTLTRENALLWIPLPLLWIAVGGMGVQPKRRVILAAGYCTGLFLTLFPVAARNAYVGGEWSPTTFQSGPNFYIGNNLNANGIYQPLVPGHETPMYERADAERLAVEAEGRPLTSREVSRFWMGLAIDDILAAPGRWISLMTVKVLMTINRYEVPDVESMEVYRQFSVPIRLFSGIWNFGVLCPLAIMGIALSWRERRQHWLIYLLSLSMLAAVALFFILGRYRYPLVPLLIPFAAYALLACWNAFRKRETHAMGWPVSLGLVMAIFCHLPIHDKVTLEASSLMNQGAAAGQAGNFNASIEWLSQAIQMQPEMPEAYFNLGRALSLNGRYSEAVAAFQETQRQAPDMVMVDFQLAQTLEKLGDRGGALRHYQRAAELEPQDERARLAIRRLSQTP